MAKHTYVGIIKYYNLLNISKYIEHLCLMKSV